jgi:hypothetical protein
LHNLLTGMTAASAPATRPLEKAFEVEEIKILLNTPTRSLSQNRLSTILSGTSGMSIVPVGQCPGVWRVKVSDKS